MRALALLPLLLVACGDERAELLVDLRTDLVPGVEFLAVTTTVDSERDEATAVGDVSYVEGRRVATFSTLERGSKRLTLQLLGLGGRIVAERAVTFEFESDVGITVVITRNCSGVSCEDPAASSCLAGRCVPAGCIDGLQPECGSAACASDSDCDAPAAACATATCGDGVCYARADDSVCAADEYCAAEIGCEMRPDVIADAGMPPPGELFTWGFDDPGEYAADDGRAEIESGFLRLPTVLQAFNDWTPTELAGGTTMNVSWDGARLELDGATTGTYASPVIDAGDVVDWSGIAWSPERPSGKPVVATSEVDYPRGSVDTTGLVLLAHMDRVLPNVPDSSGNDHDGTSVGASLLAEGIFGSSASIAGDGRYLSFGDPPGLNVTDGFSVAMWVRRTAAPSRDVFIASKESDPVGSGWCIYIDGTGAVWFCVGGGGTPSDTVTSATFTDLDTWMFIAGVHRRGSQVIYVDGAPQSLAFGGNHDVDITPSAFDLEVGRRYSMNSHLDGHVDELVLFDRELSANEIRELYLRGATRLRFQVRGCDTPDCAGSSFVGPDGTVDTWFSEELNTTSAPPRLAFDASVAAPSRYFQWRAELFTRTTESPRFGAVDVAPAHIWAGETVVTTEVGAPFDTLTGFREIVTTAHTAESRYQLSADGGSTWWYVNDGTWRTAISSEQASPAADVDAAAGTFADAAGSGELHVRIVLRSMNGEQPAAIDAIEVGTQAAP